MREDDAGEAELVARAQLDPAAFAPLYRQYFDPVCRYCYLRLGSWEAAEDAAGTVFARALAALPRLTYREGSFSGWLFTIAFNVVANDRRAQRHVELSEEVSAIADPAPSPEDLAMAAAERQALRDLLAHLPAALCHRHRRVRARCRPLGSGLHQP